jgi:hypothetical protein
LPGADDPPPGEGDADAVTVTVLAGAAGWLLDDAQPAASATQASATPAAANRPAPENPAPENTAVPFVRVGASCAVQQL